MINQIVYEQWTFGDADIHSGSVYIAMSLMSDSLEANTFSATVECADRTILDFQRNTPLTYFFRGVQRGIFYVQSITREGPTTYTISATSAIGFLIEGIHYGGIYTGQLVEDILPSICGTVPYVVKTNLRKIALYGWLPVASSRDNLSQVLFAIGAVIRTDLDGVLHIERLWDGISGTFSRDRMYMGPSVEYASKVTQVVVTEHQYIEGGETTTLFEGTAQAGDIITFDGPMYNLQATGFSIQESGANYAILSTGTGTLTGTAYVHNTRQVTEDVLTANEPNIITVEDATLISLVNSRTVASRIANYYQSFQTISADAAYEGEDPGDLLSTWHPYDLEAVSACLKNADINLSKNLKASEQLLVGFVPPVEEETEILENKVILTGSGTWTPPEGATSAHVVLIGGGGPGESGETGEATISTSKHDNDQATIYVGSMSVGSSESWNASTSINVPSEPAGEGGAGGKAGIAGNVYEVDIDLVAGESISYSCGAAGSNPGSAGGTTTFGSYTSASGGVLPGGYTDLTDGTTYALPGTAGVKGGNGGSSGQQGESVASSTGGYPGEEGSDRESKPIRGETSFYTVSGTEQGSFSVAAPGGGGAGGGTNSNPGQNGENGEYNHSGGIISGSGVTINPLEPGGGGAGANGEDGKTYGSAGSGGHGGGGAGGSGNMSASASSSGSVKKTADGSITLRYYSNCHYSGFWIRGGGGGSGGKGMPGCIIIYYGVKKTVETGPIVADGKLFLDKFGRRMVV